MTLKQILGDLKLVWKKQKITLRPMGIIWQLFAFSFQPIWIFWRRQTMVSLIPDSRSVPNLCLWLALALKSVWGVVRGTFGMLGEGNCMYHTALKWLVKLKIRTIEGCWSSIIQSNSIIVEKWSTQIILLHWIFLLFWIFALFKEIDYVEKAGYIRAVMYFYS